MKYQSKGWSQKECEEYANAQRLPESDKARVLQKWHRGTFGSEYKAGYADGYLPGWLSGARQQMKYVVRILLLKHKELTASVEDDIKWADDEELDSWFDDLIEERVPAKFSGLCDFKRKEG